MESTICVSSLTSDERSSSTKLDPGSLSLISILPMCKLDPWGPATSSPCMLDLSYMSRNCFSFLPWLVIAWLGVPLWIGPCYNMPRKIS